MNTEDAELVEVVAKIIAECGQPDCDVCSTLRRQTDRIASGITRVEEALTPSAETKAAYHGEFTFTIYEQADEQMCEVPRKLYVPWDTIKEIMAAIRTRASLAQDR